MSYQRVAPRDLFNEANFLKCLGQLSLDVHEGFLPEIYFDEDEYLDHGSQLTQDEDGNLVLESPLFRFKCGDEELFLYRKLNSRDPWPLMTIDHDGDAIPVFNHDGKVSGEFKHFLKKYQKVDAHV